MIYFAKLFYNFFLHPILMVITLFAAIFNSKIRKGFEGRMNSITTLKGFNENRHPGRLTYWFHAASFGEYEQIRPVLAGLKEIEPNSQVVVSFFSPSGFNNVLDDHIDCKIFLPFDFPWTIRKALNLVKPKKLIFAAYDIWPNLIWSANNRKIHTTLFGARFVHKTKKLKPIIKQFYRTVYSAFKTIYTVDKYDYVLVQKLVKGEDKPLLRILGNPRYDQVKAKADEFTVSHTEHVLERDKRIIAGSLHQEDEQIILDTFVDILTKYDDVKLVWVPHEPNKANVRKAESFFTHHGFACEQLKKKTIELPNAKVVIVSVVGILARLYWQGQIAYIGGGFSTGVHNTMEPAIARLPVIFGPRNKEFHATGELINSGGGFEVNNDKEFSEIMDKLLSNKHYLLKCSYAATDVIHKNLGSATRVVRGIIRD